MCVQPPAWQLSVRTLLILVVALLSGACESLRPQRNVAARERPIQAVEVFSEAELVSTYVRAATSDAYCDLMDGVLFQERLVAAVNQLRAKEQKCGDQVFLASLPLTWNVKLQKAAYGHSSQMAMSNLISHSSLDARRPADRVRAMNYQFAAMGENICAGEFDIPGVLKAWLDSPSHCKQMLSSEYSEIGLACVKREKGFYRRYWTMILARPLLEIEPAKE